LVLNISFHSIIVSLSKTNYLLTPMFVGYHSGLVSVTSLQDMICSKLKWYISTWNFQLFVRHQLKLFKMISFLAAIVF